MQAPMYAQGACEGTAQTIKVRGMGTQKTVFIQFIFAVFPTIYVTYYSSPTELRDKGQSLHQVQQHAMHTSTHRFFEFPNSVRVPQHYWSPLGSLGWGVQFR